MTRNAFFIKSLFFINILFLIPVSTAGQANDFGCPREFGEVRVYSEYKWTAFVRETIKKNDLFGIVFGNSNTAWINDRKGISRSDDGGLTWKAVDVDVPKEFEIAEIVAGDSPNKLWVILEKFDADVEKREIRLLTTSDRGKKWITLIKRMSAFSGTLFIDHNGHLWLSYSSYPPAFRANLLESSDDGKNWIDKSRELIGKFPAYKSLYQYPLTNVFRLNRDLTVVNLSGMIFSTNDDRRTWLRNRVSL